MKKETLTLTRALVELKMLGKRISANVEKFDPVVIQRGGKLPEGVKSTDEFAKSAKANFQSVQDLMVRRGKIKSALVNANAVTKIEINGVEMTIAEAIERKSSICQEKELLEYLKLKYADAINSIERENKAMKGQLLKLLEATYSKSEAEISKEDHDKVAIPFKENNEAKLVDPLELKGVIQELEESIDAFETEVDVALSEINAQVEIEI